MTASRHHHDTLTFAVPVDDALVTLTVRLTEEYPALAAGSVMRCVARAALRARLAGVPRDLLPAEAERTARSNLDGRVPVAAGPRSA